MLLQPFSHRTTRVSYVAALLAAALAGLVALLLCPAVGVAAATYHGTYVYDTFERGAGRGWGDAGMGGTYTAVGGAPEDFGVAEGAGWLRVYPSGSSRSAMLNAVAVRDVDVRLAFTTDTAPGGWGQTVYVATRSQADAAEYRLVVRLAGDGKVYTQAVSWTQAGMQEISPEVVAAGVAYRPGMLLWVRAQAVGAGPTVLRSKVWPDGQEEPATWSFTGRDVTARLQGVGGVGLRVGLAAESTAPVTVKVYRLFATDPEVGGATYTGTFYVAPWGDDGFDGSSDRPWRTPQHAADVAGPGATVNLAAGTYPGFVVRRSGLTFAGVAGGETVVSDSRNIATFDGVNGGVLRNVTLTGATEAGSAGVLVANSNGVTLEGNRMVQNRTYGVHTWNSTNVTIRNNEVAYNDAGVVLELVSDGAQILNNRIHDHTRMVDPTDPDKGGAIGVGFLKTTGPVTAWGNTLWKNRAPLSNGGFDGSNFEVFGASDLTITHNTMWDAEHAMETGTDGPPCNNLVFTRNVAYAASTQPGWAGGLLIACGSGNSVIANNVLDGFDVAAISVVHRGDYRFQGPVDGLRITNNVLSSSGTQLYHFDGSMAGVSVDHNLLWSNNGWLAFVAGRGVTNRLGDLTAWTGFEASGMVANPGFSGSGGRDYRLGAGTPAVDTGLLASGGTGDADAGAPAPYAADVAVPAGAPEGGGLLAGLRSSWAGALLGWLLAPWA